MFKRYTSFFLVLALLLPMAWSVGCGSTNSSKTGSVFKMPKIPTLKKETKPTRPKKDPDIPVTMSGAMMLERNDVL